MIFKKIYRFRFIDILIKTVIATVVLLILFFIYDISFPFRPTLQYSTVIYASDGSVLHSFLNDDEKWMMEVEINEINENLRKTIIFKEDKYFYHHFGINPLAVLRALTKNIIQLKITSGASTISMQVARLLKPAKRTYFSKFREMLCALQLEMHYSKNEILQMYLNLLPYGGNIVGIKSASLLYFEQLPQNLSLSQIVLLSIIPNNPNNLIPGKNNSYLLQKRNEWLNYFKNKKLFEQEKIKDALNENVDCYRHPAPKNTPHLALRLKKEYKNQSSIKSTINPSRQYYTETLLFNYIQRLKNMNITNAAVLIINNQTHQVEAYAGSADFYDEQSYGQVDGVRAVRSPGSTLKPILYAMAFDKGLISPKTLIPDYPYSFEGYTPVNYDGKFNGMVSTEKALGWSLNIPAVNILDQFGVEEFLIKLSNAGCRSIAKRKKYLGLSAILGGCGLSLEELCRLYSSLANKGIMHYPKFTDSEEAKRADTIISEAAAFMTANILSELSRPDLPNKFENTENVPKIAWKTGTSYGRKDAWAIGFNSHFTIGVWVGNFSGKGVPELNGAEYAVPLLFQIFQMIDIKPVKNWLVKPNSVSVRNVCSHSGLPPADFCTEITSDFYIPGISSNNQCRHLVEVYTNSNESVSFCRECLPEAGYKILLYPNYLPEQIRYFEESFTDFKKMPPHNPLCSKIFYVNAPKITSLVAQMEYLFYEEESNLLMLRCLSASDVEYVFWYNNNKLIGKAKANEKLFFKPEDGENKISCTDDKGRNTDIWINVKFL